MASYDFRRKYETLHSGNKLRSAASYLLSVGLSNGRTVHPLHIMNKRVTPSSRQEKQAESTIDDDTLSSSPDTTTSGARCAFQEYTALRRLCDIRGMPIRFERFSCIHQVMRATPTRA